MNESEFKTFKREFKLPNMKTMFKMERNPFDSDPRVEEWVKHVFEYSLIDESRFKRKIKGIVAFVSYFYPFCRDIKRFENLVKFYLLFFVLDDHTECDWGDVARNAHKAKEVWTQAILALDKILYKDKSITMRGWKPYNVLWYLVLKDICRDLNEVSKRRLLQTLRDYCNGNITESEQIQNNFQFKHIQEIIEVRLGIAK